MMMDDTELLRRYVADRSESAFAELVRRHIDLVYSAALRLMSNDAHLAEDVTQAVFADLARKAKSLVRHTSLTGWLYTSARYQAANVRRTEMRRRNREQESYAMNQLLHSPDPEPDWNELRPVLDDVMHSLSESDREAVLLRFFERQPLAAIGKRFGLSENAARMRVDRALDKLRLSLAKRGITSSTAALAAVLTSRAVGAAPQALALKVSQNASATATTGGLLLILTHLMMSTKIKLTLGSVAVAALLTTAYWFNTPNSSAPPQGGTTRSQIAGSQVASPGSSTTPASATNAAAESADDQIPANNKRLALTLITADGNQPIPNVSISFRSSDGNSTVRKTLSTTRSGQCDVDYSETTKELRLVTQSDGFADTILLWNPGNGESIPASYTLRLQRSVPIGGRVLDEAGNPIADAKVGFGTTEDPTGDNPPESHRFGWIEVLTDAEGRWKIDRIASHIIRSIHGGVSHPEYISSPRIFVSNDVQAEKELREGKHIFRMAHGLPVRGIVVDLQGKPIPGAKVAAGSIGSAERRSSTSGSDGTFSLSGCKPGETFLTAEADGFAPTTETILLSPNSSDVRIVLKPGKALRIRVINSLGEPIARASIWLNPFTPRPAETKPPVQVEFNPKTDSEGRAVWENAPDEEHTFSIQATGYMGASFVKLRPSDQEHVVKLSETLTITGTVHDEETGKPIPQFRIITGWPNFNPFTKETNAQWSSLERFWLKFGGGQFRHTFNEHVVAGSSDPAYMFKFEADGYAPFTSRVIKPDEKEVTLNVRLRPAKTVEITVLLPDGRPAPDTDVAFVRPNANIDLTTQGFSRMGLTDGGALVTTDKQGRFRLPPDDSITQIAVAHLLGFAKVPSKALSSDSTIHLEPWGSLEITALSGGKPATHRTYVLQFDQGGLELRFNNQEFKKQPDSEGKIAFTKVPPGKLKVARLIPSGEEDGNRSWTFSPVADVEILPGETAKLTLGQTGHTVKGKLSWPPGINKGKDQRAHAFLHTTLPPQYQAAMQDQAAAARLQQSPEFQEFVKNMKTAQVEVKSDGTLLAEDVLPGDYTLTVMVSRHSDKPGPVAPVATAYMPVTIPAESSGGEIDLGNIVLSAAPPTIGRP